MKPAPLILEQFPQSSRENGQNNVYHAEVVKLFLWIRHDEVFGGLQRVFRGLAYNCNCVEYNILVVYKCTTISAFVLMLIKQKAIVFHGVFPEFSLLFRFLILFCDLTATVPNTYQHSFESRIPTPSLWIIRELKHRRFRITDANRKFMFLLLARFNARPLIYKALILAFTARHFKRRESNTRRRRSFDFRFTSGVLL